eukprot:NODE_6933_length_827_cov_46.073864_g6333_i0.p1 GENE.NODE_6933_length_827_cov_46.073864_g6333_i0~~NODE_6933_length_827_cov_46.073864_g6333_i0.p1  ORF type:complete len:173 (+),score=36.90 NODE_6933_length_827_cov_46.073864_g6333_i0:109-627(+)
MQSPFPNRSSIDLDRTLNATTDMDSSSNAGGEDMNESDSIQEEDSSPDGNHSQSFEGSIEIIGHKITNRDIEDDFPDIPSPDEGGEGGELSQWLDGIGLPQYTQAFQDYGIGLGDLSSLNGETLERIGVKTTSHKERILTSLTQLHDVEEDIVEMEDSTYVPTSPLFQTKSK